MLKKIALLLGILIFVPQPAFAMDYMMASNAANTNPVRTAIQGVRPTIKAELQTARASFKEAIQQIKDTRKKTILEGISNGITNANTNRTNMMSNALSRFSEIITNLSSKSASLKSQGKDTTTLDTAISNAQAAITAAQAAVNAQKAKTYSADISNETNLKSPVAQMVLQFKTDILAVYQLVVTAKQDVVKAMQEWAKLNSESNPSASSSATQSTIKVSNQ